MAPKPKITPEEKKQIIAEFQTGDYSKYRIAKNHGISETMVRYIIHPEKIAENRKNTVKNTVKNNARVRAFRERHKKEQSQTLINTKNDRI